MFRSYLSVFFFFFCSSLFAADRVSVDLQNVRLRDLVQVVYADVLSKNFVVDNELLSDESRLTLKLSNVDGSVVEREVLSVLRSRGYSLDPGAVVRVYKSSRSSELPDLFVYRPSFRSSQYLIDLSSSFVDPKGFTVRRSSTLLSDVSSKSSSVVSMPESGVNSLASKDADVVVYVGSKADCDRLRDLFSRLDLPVSQVTVKAVIYEVQKTQKEGSALDLAFSILKSKIGLSVVGSVARDNSVSVTFKGLGLDFNAFYSALSSDDRFKLLSSPVLRVASGGHARFSVGQEVPVLGGVTYDGFGKQVQSVQYKDAGVILDLHADVRGQVTDLRIDQQISQFVSTVTGVNSTPTLVKRQLSTVVQAADGDVFAVGGLNETGSKGVNAGFSFLPAFFRSSSSEEKSTELLLLLQVTRI